MGEVFIVLRKRKKAIKYYKPNIGALHGPVGMSIVETIKNTPRSDHAILDQKCEAVKKKAQMALEDGTF